jgi:hypothetical protein
MIRVDEIYNNTFWTWLQENIPHARLFFCDPPGTSSPDNLFNYGTDYDENYTIPNGELAEYTLENDYFFFHDQEPIHLDIHLALFDEVIECNADMNPKQQGNIIISEKNSDMVDELLKLYKWKSHYYFYHGWTAMDWYRGYDKTFLVPRAKDRKPTKTFVGPNRIIGGKRDHRVLFLYLIFKNNLEDNYITAPKICPEENIDINEIAKKYTTYYPDIIDVIDNANLPILFENEETQLMTSCWITNFNESADSLFYVPTETVYFGRRWHLTEKTFKPIALEMPFILVATAGSLKYLRDYGFKTFNGIIDESYDEETDDILRLEKITHLLKEIDNLSAEERLRIHRRCLPIVEHNYNHFYGGNFEKILWEELTGMIDTWK